MTTEFQPGDSQLQRFVADVRARIEAQPLRAFYWGIALGVVLALFARYLIPLGIIAALVAGILWFFSDEAPEDSSKR